MLNAHYVSSDLLCSVPLILILLQHQPYSEFPTSSSTIFWRPGRGFTLPKLSSTISSSPQMNKFPSLLSSFWLQWQGKATHRNACRFAASAHVHRVSNGFKWHLWASWGSLTPFSLLHVLNRIEPRLHAHLCGSNRSKWFWASETSLHTVWRRFVSAALATIAELRDSSGGPP